MTRNILVAVAFALVGCNQPPDAEFDLVTARELELQVDALDARADAVAAKLEERAKNSPAPAAGADPKREEEAFKTYQSVQEALANNEFATARERLAKLKTFNDVPPAVRAAAELEGQIGAMEKLIGSEAPPLETEKWFVGQTDLNTGKATVLVFWEVWCPHCQREVPELQATYDKYKGQGLNMVGLTQVNNGKTEEDVMSFLTENSVSYPVAKAPQSVPEFYQVQGIPAAAVVKDGKVVWRGHPGTLTDEMVQGWL